MKLLSRCTACNSEEIHPLKGYYEKHKLVKCNNCSFVFGQRIPTEDELNRHYSTYSYSSDQSIPDSTVSSYHKLLDEFEKYRKNNRLLDVGCGRGWFLQEAKKRGWEVYGTEFSDKALEICTANGINMKKGALSAGMFEEETFDIITSFEVIEHINNPTEELAAIKQLLRKNGLFYCTTPNFNSVMRYYLKDKYNVIEYPEHLSYYTRRSIRRTGKKAGFRLLKLRTTGISITRIQQSLKTAPPKQGVSADEALRTSLTTKWYLKWVKGFVNFFLNATGTGLTLKAYFTK